MKKSINPKIVICAIALVVIAFFLRPSSKSTTKVDGNKIIESQKVIEVPYESPNLVVINNSSRVTHALSGKITISVDGGTPKELKIGDSLELDLPEGSYTLELSHWDLLKFSSKHPITISKKRIYIQATATALSNEISIHRTDPR
jgi:hypothetical protein